MRVKAECEKASLKLNIQKTKIMASGHNTSWQIEGEKVENSDRFYFLGELLFSESSVSSLSPQSFPISLPPQ